MRNQLIALSFALVSCGLPWSVRAASVVQEPIATTPDELYQQRFVWFYDTVVISGMSTRNWRPYRGRYRAPLDGADFYRAIERPDLASRYRVRRAVRVSLYVSGFAALGVGFVLAARHHETAGVIVAAAGLGTAFVTGLTANDPVGESEARFLADQYNRKLKADLRLAPPGEEVGPAAGESRSQVRSNVTWQLLPAVSPTQAGVAWVLAF